LRTVETRGSRAWRRLAAVVLILTAACSTQTASGAADYVLRESAIDGPSNLIGLGDTTLYVSNTGEYSHTLIVTDEEGEVMGATGLVESGEDTTLEVDLEPGTYVFSCRIVAEDDEGNLRDHYEQGMHRTVTVTG
jgi:methionine-rich copper-binding protein CopC